MSWYLSIFKPRTCILHHFTFLDWLPTHIFSTPISHFQPLKTHFLTTILPFLAMSFMDLKGFVYTITVNVYAFRLAFSGKSHCIQQHFTLRFAPNCLAFCTKLPCILHQNALHLALKRTPFSTKTHYIQQQIAPKLVQIAVVLNKNSFCRNHKLAPFCIKTNLRENRFFAAR